MKQLKVSIIVPAYNCAATITETLQSVLDQTFADWEALIVDDGSTDETGKIVNEYLKKDKRFRFLKQENSGVSAARNRGIENAAGEWLLFLDADDLIKPDMLEKMIKGAVLHPECDLILCNWERLTLDGKIINIKETSWSTADAFNLFADSCVFCIHSCIVKKYAVENVGKFDESLVTCEDWDLWQRIARTGAKFTAINNSLSVYRMRSASASNKGIQLFKDGLEVIRRGHSNDCRVKNPDEKYKNGAPAESLKTAVSAVFTWSAGLLFGSGDDPSRLFQHLEGKDFIFDFETFCNEFFIAAALPTGHSYEILEKLIDEHKETLKNFLHKLEHISSIPGLEKRSFNAFRRFYFEEVDFTGTKRLGSSLGIEMDITKKINHLRTDPDVERAVIKVKAGEKLFGTIELPVTGGFVHNYVIKDAVADNYSWQILGEFFKENIYKKLSLTRNIGLKIRIKQYNQNIPENSRNYFEKLHDFIGWTIFLQEIFNRPFWTSKRFYRSSRQLKPAPTLNRNNDPFTVEIGNEIPNLKLNKENAVVVITAGGNASGVIKLSGRKKIFNAQEVRSIIIKELGYDLCKMVVREVLLEEDLKEHISLNKKVKEKYRQTWEQYSSGRKELSYSITDEIEKIKVNNEKGIILPRRDSFYPDDSSQRFAVLPPDGMFYHSGSFFTNEGEKIKLPGAVEKKEKLQSSDQFKYLIYSPNVIIPEKLNSLKINTDEPRKALKKSGVKPKWNTGDLPVLMYHRIAPSGSDLTKQYRITPAEFEKQMQYLYKNDYYTVSFEEWYSAVKSNKPLPGKAIILTFDDGYFDFYQYAFPVLAKYRYGAYVFIVTDYTGESNAWDEALGEKISLMSWEQILELNNHGIRFGSHTATHQPLTALNTEQLACQFLNSLNILREHLGPQINSIAYPYGDYDPIVKHLAGACGYTFALTCDEGKCNKFSELLELPRIEISGLDSLGDFVQKLERLPIYPV